VAWPTSLMWSQYTPNVHVSTERHAPFCRSKAAGSGKAAVQALQRQPSPPLWCTALSCRILGQHRSFALFRNCAQVARGSVALSRCGPDRRRVCRAERGAWPISRAVPRDTLCNEHVCSNRDSYDSAASHGSDLSTAPRSGKGCPARVTRLRKSARCLLTRCAQGLVNLDGESKLIYPLSTSVGWLEGRLVDSALTD
jgi:hypothetical protein